MSATCAWCRDREVASGRGSRFCSKRCRQAAFRQRSASSLQQKRREPVEPGTFEYADPPYPGFAWMYRDQPSFKGEVDHRKLVRRLCADLWEKKLLGFALSTSSKTLHMVLDLFTDEGGWLRYPQLRIAGWFKPVNAGRSMRGAVARWEPIIVAGGRDMPPGFRDWFEAPEDVEAVKANVARLGGGQCLTGRKPQRFCAFVFDLLGMVPGDTLIDTYPGTGIVTRAWAEVSACAAALPSPPAGERHLLAGLPLFEGLPPLQVVVP